MGCYVVQDAQAHYVTEDGLELPVLLPPPPKSRDYRHVAPSGVVLFLIDAFKRTGLDFFHPNLFPHHQILLRLSKKYIFVHIKLG